MNDEPNMSLGPHVAPSYETGLFLALNAIENAGMVMNSPRCSFVRGLKVFLHNDLFSSVYRSDGQHRLLTTQWMGFEDVQGDEAAFVRLLTEAAGLPRFEWIFASQNISSLISGFDLTGLCQDLARQLGRPILAIPGPQLESDWRAGYDAALAALLPHLLSLTAADDQARPELALIGHLWCRNEADEQGNVREMRRLLAGLDLADSVIWLSGGPLPPLRKNPKHLALLSYAGPRTREAVMSLGCQPEFLPLPLGIQGTVRWIEAIGALVGRPIMAQQIVERELQALLADIDWLVAEHLIGRSVATVGDPPLVQALTSFAQELGMDVVAAFPLGGRADLPSGVPTYPDASADTFVSTVRNTKADVVLGSGAYGTAARFVPCIEVGFPSYRRHLLYDRPYLGFSGVRCLVEALLQALLSHDEQD